MSAEPNRKLSTIVFSDIVGYSRMMNEDEAGTLKLLGFHDRIANEIISGYRGKILKKLGDGLLISFESVSDAFTATQLLQEEFKSYNTEHKDFQKLLVRIGVHVGDVIEKDGDIFGNGVNVAARLQQICVPGGICFSQSAHAALGQPNTRNLRLVSDVALKNIAESYNVFMLPSIYPDEFPINQVSGASDTGRKFVINSMKRIPPEKFSFVDSLLVSVGAMVLIDFLIVNALIYYADYTLNQAILELSGRLWFGVYNIIFISFFTYIFLRDSVKIHFEDVRGVDEMLSFIIQRFGFKPPKRKDGQLIYKPTVYNFLMWWTQSIRVAINGNEVTISGSFMFLRKVKKMLKSYQEKPNSSTKG